MSDVKYDPELCAKLSGMARRFMPSDLSKEHLSSMADQLDAARKIIHDVRLFARSCDNSGPEDGGNYTYLEVARALRRILGDDK